MTRRETPTRQGRAADALIASYVRELLNDGEPDAAAERPSASVGKPLSAAVEAAVAAADATR